MSADEIVPRRTSFQTDAGLTLAADAWGDPAAPPVLLLHGGGQTRHAWAATARRLVRAGWYAVTLDARGHGDSDRAPNGDYRLDSFVADLRSVARTFERAPAIIGASLGGVTALVYTGEGGASRALVLVDIALRARDEGIDAIRAFMLRGKDGFDSLDAAADAIAAYLPHRKRPRRLEGLRKNLREGGDGRFYWHWDPEFYDGSDLSEQRDGGRLNHAARGLHIPVLLVRGAESDVVSAEIAREFLAAVPQAELVEVAGARHMVSGHENDAFANAILAFLESLRDEPAQAAS